MLTSGHRPARRAERPTIAIVGAGASGTLTTVQLLRCASQRGFPIRAVLIDRRPEIGGVAYSTNDPRHRLNVASEGMSALPDEPEHFLRWRRAGAAGPGKYAPRGEYRHYLEDMLATAQRDGAPDATHTRMTADVARLDLANHRVRLQFRGGDGLEADAAVLAVGNLPAQPPPGCEAVVGHPAYVNDPWAPGALERLQTDARGTVLLIGTGLTMVDVAITLASRIPHARLRAASRSGLLPRAHLGGAQPHPVAELLDPARSLPELVDVIVSRSVAGSPGWQQLVDELRPRTQALWKLLTTEERAEFLATRHRAWCVRRHRMPPQVAAMLAELLESERLMVRGGSVELSAAGRHGLAASISGAPPRDIALAVNCTGPGLDPQTSHDPLVAQILRDGYVRRHPLGIGFDTAPHGAFYTRDDGVSEHLFTLGPPRMGELYESTAVPEIRDQAQDLAATLLDALAGARPSRGAAGSPGGHTARGQRPVRV
ncbi:MAG TPA: FAD/NAD(P)-binding protein [Solirubrobacteraceae bacterium]|jgi:uncharacterized NAD(P)/FAD-binding protein YdhS